jgi:hypothetical protein
MCPTPTRVRHWDTPNLPNMRSVRTNSGKSLKHNKKQKKSMLSISLHTQQNKPNQEEL